MPQTPRRPSSSSRPPPAVKPLPPPVAELLAAQVDTLGGLFQRDKDRLRQKEDLRPRNEDVVIVSDPTAYVSHLSGREGSVAQELAPLVLRAALEYVKESGQHFGVRITLSDGLQTARLSDSAVSGLMSGVRDSRDLGASLQREASRVFGPEYPVTRTPHGAVPQLQSMVRHSAPVAAAVIAASAGSDELLEEIRRRNSLCQILAWPEHSSGEHVIRSLSRDWTTDVPLGVSVDRARLDRLVRAVLGRAFAPGAVPGDRYSDIALNHEAVLRSVAPGGLFLLSAPERARLEGSIKAMDSLLGVARESATPEGLGLDVAGFMESAGERISCVFEPESVFAQILAGAPSVSHSAVLARARTLLSRSVNSGLPKRFLAPSALFSDCGLWVDGVNVRQSSGQPHRRGLASRLGFR